MNEQEHYRDFVHANVDDKTLHELYLWPFADAVRAGVGSVMSYVLPSQHFRGLTDFQVL